MCMQVLDALVKTNFLCVKSGGTYELGAPVGK